MQPLLRKSNLGMGYFALLFLLYSWIAISSTWQMDIWSPIDEIAHYDYIVKVSSGILPVPTEAIADETANLSIHYFNWITGPNYAGTKDTMGLAGLSYEAQQPPFYYIVMAGPYWVINSLIEDPVLKIKLLREVGVLSQCLAAILIGFCIHKSRRFCEIHPIWIGIIPVMAMIPGWDWRGTINNGNMALLMVSITCFCLLTYLSNPRNVLAAGLCVLFAVLSFLTKYTYALLPALVGGFILWVNHRKAGTLRWHNLLLIFSPLLLVIIYFGINGLRYGFDDILGTKSVTNMFSSQVSLTIWGFGLIKSLVTTAIGVPYLQTNDYGVLIFLIGCALTFIQIVRLAFQKEYKSMPLYIVCLGMVVTIMASAWGLSKLDPFVHWGFFRHYSGFLGFWLVACLGFAFRPGVVQKITTAILTLALIVPVWIYFF